MSHFKEIDGLVAIQKEKYRQTFVSGDRDGRLKVTYFYNKENGHLYTKVRFGRYAVGPPNHAHGGAISALFDEAMGAVAWIHGYPCMTIQIKVNFRKLVKLESEFLVDTWIDYVKGKKVVVKGKMIDADNVLYSKSKGLYHTIKRSLSAIRISTGRIFSENIIGYIFKKENSTQFRKEARSLCQIAPMVFFQ